MAAHVLVVATSRNMMDDGQLTGVWAEELAAPWLAFAAAGCRITLASVKGGPIPFDPRSVHGGGPQPDSVQRFLADRAAMVAVQVTPAIAETDIADVDAVFLPGGHGTLWDLPGCVALADRIGSLLDHGRIVAALCHGAAGLVSAKRRDGRPRVAGRRVTAFTDTEEEKVGLAEAVPFLLEGKLRDLGADFVAAPDFQPHVVADGNLITGQNPASSDAVAQAVLQALQDGAALKAAE